MTFHFLCGVQRCRGNKQGSQSEIVFGEVSCGLQSSPGLIFKIVQGIFGTRNLSRLRKCMPARVHSTRVYVIQLDVLDTNRLRTLLTVFGGFLQMDD